MSYGLFSARRPGSCITKISMPLDSSFEQYFLICMIVIDFVVQSLCKPTWLFSKQFLEPTRNIFQSSKYFLTDNSWANVERKWDLQNECTAYRSSGAFWYSLRRDPCQLLLSRQITFVFVNLRTDPETPVGNDKSQDVQTWITTKEKQ